MNRVASATVLVFALAILLVPPLHSDDEDTDFDVVLADVQLRPGVTADLRVRVYVNESQPCADRVVLIVPGTHSTADPWPPLGWFGFFIEPFFEHNPAGRKVCRVAVLDLPGHGGSSLPRGGPVYGDLTLADYAAALIGALERLPAWGVRPMAILGYSRGGIVTALAQQALVERGMNLRKAFGIKKVLLLSPVPPAEIEWDVAQFRAFLYNTFYSCYTGPGGVYTGWCGWMDTDSDGDVDYGDLLQLNSLWFQSTLVWDCDPTTTPMGMPPLPAPVAEGLCDPDPTTPLGDTFLSNWWGVHEAATPIYEATGSMQYERPVTDRGIFRRENGTVLWSVGLAMDTTVRPSVTAASYEHYADDPDLTGFVLVEGPTSDHLMMFFDPEGLLEGIAGSVRFP